MKKHVLLFAALAALFITGVAEAGNNITGSIESTFAERYLSSGGSVCYNDPVQKTEMTLFLPNGFYGDIFWAADWRGEPTWGDEVDWTTGWAGKAGPLYLDLGISYWDCQPQFDSKSDYVQPYMEISKKLDLGGGHSISPFIKGKFIFPLNSGEDDSQRYYVGLKHSWKTGRFSIRQKVCAFHNTAKGGILGDYELRISYKLWRELSLVGDFQIMSSLYEVRRYGEDKTAVGVGLSYNF